MIWEPMLAGDSRENIDRTLLDDPRVTSFWEPDRISGTWLAQQRLADFGDPVVWDAYYAFPAAAHWGARPDHVVAAGSPIIGATGALERDYVPLLATRTRR